jgi:hypothetical protein
LARAENHLDKTEALAFISAEGSVAEKQAHAKLRSVKQERNLRLRMLALRGI